MGVSSDKVSDIGISPALKKRRNKRLTNYWDILYRPGSKDITEKYTWNIDNSNGPRSSICPSVSRLKLSGASFSNCDFDGVFTKLFFADCNFTDCDFASQWKYVKFSGCTFSRCSFTMTSFRNCKFSDCKWDKISVSGSETRLEYTVVSNPIDFIAATYTNLDAEVLKNNNKAISYQLYRHEHTKAKLSRRLFVNSQASSDEGIYYQCVKLYLIQSIDSKKYAVKHQIENGGGGFFKNMILRSKLAVFSLERKIIKISGWVNGWGGSLVRPAALGLSIILLFSIIYNFELNGETIKDVKTFAGSYWKSLIMAADVTFLFGYTKHLNVDTKLSVQFTGIVNAVLGLWWYAIFVPTVINRICRVKV